MEYKKRLNRKRLAVDIPTNLFEMVRDASFDSHCTITKYVITSLISKLKLEGRDKINKE